MLLKGEDRFFTGELPYCEVRAFPCTRFHFTFAVHARQRRQVPVVGTVRLSSPESDRERTVNSVRVRLASTVREAARPIAPTGCRGRSTFVTFVRAVAPTGLRGHSTFVSGERSLTPSD